MRSFPSLGPIDLLITIDQDVYTTVICPRAWNEKKSLESVNKEIKKIGKQNVKMDDLWKLRASTYLHEILHHGVVSNPPGKPFSLRRSPREDLQNS